MTTKEKLARVFTRIPERLYKKVKIEAGAQETTVQVIIRRAVESYFEKSAQ
jgi:predicted DNA binding CopG/RHH family protein